MTKKTVQRYQQLSLYTTKLV